MVRKQRARDIAGFSCRAGSNLGSLVLGSGLREYVVTIPTRKRLGFRNGFHRLLTIELEEGDGLSVASKTPGNKPE